MFRLYRLFGVIFLFMVFIVGAVVMRFYAVTELNRRRVSCWWTHKMCRTGARFLGLNVHADGAENIPEGGCLVLSNHMSYLDIMVYSSVRPAVFVTSVEMEQTFFLGFIAKIGGSYFVERRNTKNIKQELSVIADLIDQGFVVVLFPEGTSTDGSKILPFRSSFIAGATETGVDVVPACLRYDRINGEPFSDSNCDYVCWYGDMTFAPHFYRFMGLRNTEASASWLTAISSSGLDRKMITRKAHELIAASYFGAA